SSVMTTTNPPSNSTPNPWKPNFFQISCIHALSVLLLVMGWQSQALAQSDDFNDGNDTTPVAWTRYDAITNIFGGSAQDTCSFPGGNTYRLQAVATGDPGSTGPARVSSFPTNIYTDFYAAVDVVNWANTYSQAIGLLGRVGSFSMRGL